MWSLLPGRGYRRRKGKGMGREEGGDDTGAYPTRRCHFCNEVSLIVPPLPPSNSSSHLANSDQWSTNEVRMDETSSASSSLRRSVGTVQEAWYCSSCRCWNRYDAAQIGGMATWDEAMAGVPSQAGPISTTTNSSRSPFCHTCQTNQTLVLSMLASHDFDDEDNEEQQERWSAAIQRRYPPLCKACQPMVQARIEEKDKVARQLIYKSLLERQRQRQRQKGQVLRARTGDSTEGSDEARTRNKPKGRRTNTARGILWLFWTISGLLTSLIGITAAQQRIETRSVNIALLASILVGLVARKYDPSALLLGSHVVERRIRGLDVWRSSQTYMLIIHVATLRLLSTRPYTWPTLDEIFARAQPALFLVSLLAQLLLLYQGWSSIQLQPLQRIALQSRTVEVDNHDDSSSYTSRQASAAASSALPLSLADHDSFQQDGTSHPMSTALDELLQHPRYEVEEMDWTPSPPTKKLSSSVPSMTEANGSGGIMLGPQRFFGPKEVPTGLEDLFGAALALRDEEDQAQQDDRGKKSNDMHQKGGAILRKWRAAFGFISFVAVTVAVAASTFKWGPEWWEAWKSRANGMQRGPVWGFLREMDHERPTI